MSIIIGVWAGTCISRFNTIVLPDMMSLPISGPGRLLRPGRGNKIAAKLIAGKLIPGTVGKEELVITDFLVTGDTPSHPKLQVIQYRAGIDERFIDNPPGKSG